MAQQRFSFDYMMFGGLMALIQVPVMLYVVTQFSPSLAAMLFWLVWGVGWTWAGLVYMRRRTDSIVKQLKRTNQQLEQELVERKHLEARFATIFHKSPVPISISKLDDGKILDVNDAGIKIMGYDTREGYLNQDAVALGNWQDTSERDAMLEQLRQHGRVEAFDIHYRTKQGEVREALAYVEVAEIDGQQCKLSFTIDVTDLKHAQERLARTNAELESLIYLFPDLYFRLSPTGVLIDYMSGELPALGDIPENWLNKHVREVLPPSISNEIIRALIRLKNKQGRQVVVVEYTLGVDGAARHYELRMVRESESSVLVVARDITERHAYESRVQESEELFRQLAENMHEVLFIRDLRERRVVYMNELYFDLWRSSKDDIAFSTSSLMKNIHTDDKERMQLFLARQKRGEADDIEYRVQDNGTTNWLRARNIPIKDEKGKVYRVAVLSENITERKQQEETIHHNEIRFRTLAETMPAAVCILQDEEVVFVNSETERMTGYSADELRHIDDFALLFRDNYLSDSSWVRMRMNDEPTTLRPPLIQRIITRFGEEIWVHLSANRIEMDSRPAMLIIGIDVTSTHMAAEVLRSREEEFRALVENSPDYIIRFDKEMRYMYVNPAIENHAGIIAKAYYGKTWREMMEGNETFKASLAGTPNLIDQWEAVFHDVLSTGQEQRLEYHQDFPAGRAYFETRSVPEFDEHGDVVSVLTISRDVTESKRAEQDLRESEALFRQFAENINEIMLIRDAETRRVIYVSPAFKRIWQQDTAPLFAEENPYVSLIHPADQPRVARSVTQQHEQPTDVTYRIIRPDEQIRWLRSRTFLIRRDDGSVYRIAELTEDITERYHLDIELQSSQEIFQQVASNVKEVLFVADAFRQEIIFINEICEDIWGYTADEILADGDIIKQAIHPEDRIWLTRVLKNRRNGDTNEVEYRVHHRDGNIRWVRSRAFPVADKDGIVYRIIGVVEDITERRNMELERREKEQLQSDLEQEREMNRLKESFMAMISHEFRTPLTVILSSTELLTIYHEKLTVERRILHLNRIIDQTHYMTQLMDEVLTFQRLDSSATAFEPDSTDVQALCEQIIDDLEVDNAEHRIQLTTSGALQDVMVDSKLLRHIMTNLLSNAQKYSDFEHPIYCRVIGEDCQITIEVEDRGIGIPLEAQPTLFEPFQRAHNVGTRRGTGLGLAIVKRSVEAHNGDITFTTIIGEGTTFYVTIPTCEVL